MFFHSWPREVVGIPVRPTTPSFHFYQVYRDEAVEMGGIESVVGPQECPAYDSCYGHSAIPSGAITRPVASQARRNELVHDIDYRALELLSRPQSKNGSQRRQD